MLLFTCFDAWQSGWFSFFRLGKWLGFRVLVVRRVCLWFAVFFCGSLEEKRVCGRKARGSRRSRISRFLLQRCFALPSRYTHCRLAQCPLPAHLLQVTALFLQHPLLECRSAPVRTGPRSRRPPLRWVLRVSVFGRLTRAGDAAACPVLHPTTWIFGKNTRRTVSFRSRSRRPSPFMNTCSQVPKKHSSATWKPSVCWRSPPPRPGVHNQPMSAPRRIPSSVSLIQLVMCESSTSKMSTASFSLPFTSHAISNATSGSWSP